MTDSESVQSTPAMKALSGDHTDGWRESVSITAHNLNNALGVVRLTLDLMDQDTVEVKQAAATIREEIEQAIQLVDELSLLTQQT